MKTCDNKMIANIASVTGLSCLFIIIIFIFSAILRSPTGSMFPNLSPIINWRPIHLIAFMDESIKLVIFAVCTTIGIICLLACEKIQKGKLVYTVPFLRCIMTFAGLAVLFLGVSFVLEKASITIPKTIKDVYGISASIICIMVWLIGMGNFLGFKKIEKVNKILGL